MLTPPAIFTDDDDFDRRPQRRRYEEPLFVQVRRQLLTIAESVWLSFSFHLLARIALYWFGLLVLNAVNSLIGCSESRR
jgi:hypothetical protein